MKSAEVGWVKERMMRSILFADASVAAPSRPTAPGKSLQPIGEAESRHQPDRNAHFPIAVLMRPLRFWAFLIALVSPVSALAATTVLDFSAGALPTGASLTRATSALGSDGSVVSPDTPRYRQQAVVAGAERLAVLAGAERVLVAGEVGGVTYTLSRLGGSPAIQYPGLTTDLPGVDPSPVYLEPHPDAKANFGDSKAWGAPVSAELLPDGTVLVHTQALGAERRSGTVRTTVTTFGDVDGMNLVHVSDYSPPSGYSIAKACYSCSRTTYLPNLDLHVSAITDYASAGLASSAFPGDGRSLGYASSDGGQTYVRVIDTDDLQLGGALVDAAKHLHTVEPFEWLDPTDSEWKIGVVGVLGDGAGMCGQILVRSDGPSYPDPDQGSYPSLARAKIVGKHMLTDLFSLNGSEEPGVPLRFLHGTDRTQTGVAELTIAGNGETDHALFRPTATFVEYNGRYILNDFPYVMGFGRLANGAVIAPTWENKVEFHPNGLWVADPTGRSWTTAYIRRNGWQGVKPFGENRFWTQGFDTGTALSELWSVALPDLRSSLVLGAAAREVLSVPVFGTNVVTSDLTGVLEGPEALPSGVAITRVRSDTLAGYEGFEYGVPQAISAAEGEFVSLVYWVKPMKDDIGVTVFETGFDMTTTSGVATRLGMVDLDLNDWTRVVLTQRVPAGGATSVTPRFRPTEWTSSALPVDYAFTEPQIVITSQPTIQSVSSGAQTAADQLTVSLPPLGDAWSVAVWGTEARTFALSLVAGNNWMSVTPDDPDDDRVLQGRWSALRPEASPPLGAVCTGPLYNELDVFFPTQTMVVLARSESNLFVYVSRGMGAVELYTCPLASSFTPTELRFGTPDWERVFEGSVHRVAIWDDHALDYFEVEQQRVTPLPEPSQNRMLVAGIVALVGLASRRRH